MWIAISILVFLIAAVIGAFGLMAADEAEDHPRPPYYNPYDNIL